MVAVLAMVLLGPLVASSSASFTDSADSVTQVSAADGVSYQDVQAGGAHACALDTTGRPWCWGRQDTTIALGLSGNFAVPTLISGVTATKLTAGYEHTCASRTDGQVVCWGENDQGQLGMSQAAGTSSPTTPVLSGAAGVTKLSASGGFHTCVTDSVLNGWCWGQGGQGQLGNGSMASNLSSPTKMTVAPNTFSDIDTGYLGTCGINSGKVYCWGSNMNGEISGSPNVPVNAYTTPTLVWNGPAVKVTVGAFHGCALDAAGTAYCWGAGQYGQLGSGTTSTASTVVAVNTVQKFTDISAGDWFTCGLTTSGKVQCWGHNANYQLGDGTTNDRAYPSSASSTSGITFTKISAGGYFVCGLDNKGRIYCWGSGQSLGRNAPANTSVAARPDNPWS